MIQNCKGQIFAFDEAEDIYIGHVLHRISLRHSAGINPNTLLSATFPREVTNALKDVCLDIPPAYDLYKTTRRSRALKRNVTMPDRNETKLFHPESSLSLSLSLSFIPFFFQANELCIKNGKTT